MANLNQSFNEAVCIDEEIFFGPITDKEKIIRQHFEKKCKIEKVGESSVVENDISKNDSLYKSFPNEDSKFDSFDDSLNEEIHKMPQGTKQVTLRKSYDKIKSKKHGFYDSLEDVCSLVSNIDKCSISCEVENDSNLNNKQHVIEDSLKNPLVAVTNKSHAINDQSHFDDDSLAIIEYENTFDDSLEEINMLESIEEMDDIENAVVETQNIAVKVEQNSLFPARNLFDTSVEIICEKKKVNDCADPEESSDDKNQLYDSLSNSDFKDILRDSLEECKRPNEVLGLLKNASKDIAVDKENIVVEDENIALKTEQNSIFVSKNLYDTSVQFVCEKMKTSKVADQDESSDDKNLFDSLSNSDFKDILKDSLEESQKSNENLGILKHVTDDGVKPKIIFSKENALETSIQIIYENSQNRIKNENIFEKTNSEYNDISKDSLENSENTHENSAAQIKMKTSSKQVLLHSNINDALLLKDKSEKFQKSNENLDILKHITDDNVVKPKPIFANQNALETSVQIIYENPQNCDQNKNIFENIYSEYNDISKDSLENSENIYENSAVEIKTADKKTVPHSNVNNISLLTEDAEISQNYSENLSCYRDNTLKKNTVQNHSVMTENEVPPTSTISNSIKENFSVDSCQLKILNDNANINEDLKLQLQLEVTVGDKKCQIHSQDIKIVPAAGQNSKIEVHSVPTISVGALMNTEQYTAQNIASESDILHSSSQQLNTENNVLSTFGPSEVCSGGKSYRKFTIEDTANVTLRRKSFTSQQLSYEDLKVDYSERLSDVSLLQALDLHDISLSFLNESIIQSKDSLIPLNLCSRDQCVQKFHANLFKNENKENLPEQSHNFSRKNFCVNNKNVSPNKECISKAPNKLQKCPSFKETTKKTPGTKIPVRKIENFAVPVTPSNKATKEIPTTLSSEKIKKCQHSPYTGDGAKKTPGSTPNKIPHICKVRNTIFSKVPQIVPSKKYMNIQSPVAQYIKNYGAVKTPGFDPVLRDCMNRQTESPGHSHHQTPKGASLKPSKKKV